MISVVIRCKALFILRESITLALIFSSIKELLVCGMSVFLFRGEIHSIHKKMQYLRKKVKDIGHLVNPQTVG